MTLTELSYVAALAQERHFGRAAERCQVSQPTLSIAIKKFEEELGAVLFERSKDGVLETPLGQRIVAMANDVLARVVQIRDVAAAGRDQMQGPLALGTLPTIGPYLLPQFIPLLQEIGSQLSLYVEEGGQAELALKLRNGELDAILVAAPFSQTDVVTQPLFDEPFVLLLPASHRLAGKAAIAAADLDPAQVLLLRDGHAFREQVLAAFPHLRPDAATAEGAAHSLTQGSTLETLRHMVASGLGVTILPQAAAETPLYGANLLVIRPFEPPVPRRTLCLAWRATYARHKAIDVLRQAIQASSSAYWNYNTSRDPESPGRLVENADW